MKILLKTKKTIKDLVKAIINMIYHDGIEHSGYMSFMMLLTIFPFFVFLIAFTAFLGASDLGREFINNIIQYMPKYSIDSLKIQIDQILFSPPPSLLNLAIIGTIWTSSSFVESMRTILNRVYEITTPPSYLFRRLLSILQFLCLSMAICAAMFILLAIPIILNKMPKIINLITEYKMIINNIRYILIFLFLFVSTCAFYYIIPNAKISFKETTPGAFIATIAWLITGILFSKYIAYYTSLSVIYGSLGSIIITLLFFYIISMIFIVGAEYNAILIKRKYGKIILSK